MVEHGLAARPSSGQSPAEVLETASLMIAHLQHELMRPELAGGGRPPAARRQTPWSASRPEHRAAVLTADLWRLRRLVAAARRRLKAEESPL